MTPIQVKEIIDEISFLDISSKTKKHEYVMCRWAYCKIVKEELKYHSLESIGSYVDLDHSSVLHALKKVDKELSKNDYLKSIYEDALSKINHQNTPFNEQIKKETNLKKIKVKYNFEVEKLIKNYKEDIEKTNEFISILSPVISDLKTLNSTQLKDLIDNRIKPFLIMNKPNN